MSTSIFKIISVVAPVIITSPQDETVVKPESVTFTCESTGRPRPMINWYKNTSETDGLVVAVTNDSNTMTTNSYSGNRYITSTLTVSPSRPNDTGSYVCQAINEVIDRNSTSSLTVHGEFFNHNYMIHLYDDSGTSCSLSYHW